MARWTLEVERVTGLNEQQVHGAAKLLADNRPGCVVWCMGGTQHTTGNNNTRAYCILELALGNVGKSGRAPTSSAVTTTCRAPPTLASPQTPARLLRAGRGLLEALGPGVGRGLRVDQGPF